MYALCTSPVRVRMFCLLSEEKEMISAYCPNCGTKQDNNTTKGVTGDFILTCNDCKGGFRFYIVLKPSRTIEEADASFQATELTDSQRGTKRHSSHSKT